MCIRDSVYTEKERLENIPAMSVWLYDPGTSLSYLVVLKFDFFPLFFVMRGEEGLKLDSKWNVYFVQLTHLLSHDSISSEIRYLHK